ncbi:MAG: response regulator [Mangrovibacterium sp.]
MKAIDTTSLLLLSPHYTVITKYDGKSAWSILPELDADLIISDVLMPGMNGYELCQSLYESTV